VSQEEFLARSVPGERETTTVNRDRSLQSRISSILAVGLMGVLGLGALTWYYATAMMRQNRARQSAQALSTSRAQGEMPLPSLGRIDPPVWGPPAPGGAPPLADTPLQQVPLTPTTLTEIPLAGSTAIGGPGSTPKTPSELVLERQLSGGAFTAQPTTATAETAAGLGTSAPSEVAPGAGNLSSLLRSNVTPTVLAQVLPTQRLLLPKGAFIDCTLETAIDSTLPGMTTCIIATDTFGIDGKVVLLERGTKLVGETRGQVQQGAARVFVLWTEARTPKGVIVPLASPGADELGRSGLPGAVDRHFWERFGAAMLVSVIDGAVQAAVQSSRSGTGTVIVNPSASQDVLTEVLKSTVNIPPTVVKQQGDRIQVLVARDLDFRSVYELRSAAGK
jgi:type IV secretion system protein VirB10